MFDQKLWNLMIEDKKKMMFIKTIKKPIFPLLMKILND